MKTFNVAGLTTSEAKVLACVSASETALSFDMVSELSGVHKKSIPHTVASLMRRGYLYINVPYRPLAPSVNEVFAGDMKEVDCDEDDCDEED